MVTTNAGLSYLPPHIYEMDESIKITYFRYYGYLHYTFSPGMLLDLPSYIRNADLIIISGIWNFPVFITAYYARKFHKPYVIIPHGLLNSARIKGKSTLKKKIYFNLFSKRDLKNGIVVATCKDEKKDIQSLLGKNSKVVVIPNSISRFDFSKGITKEKISQFRREKEFNNRTKIISYHGRLNWVKGLDLLIEAFAKVLSVKPETYLLLIGPDQDNYKAFLQNLIQKLSIEDRVIFLGMLEDENLKIAVASSDLNVLPSHSENFGMSVIESLSLGVPILISDQVGIHDDIESYKAGLICKVSIDSIYENLLHGISDTFDKSIMISNGYRLIDEQYNPIKNAQKLIDTIK